MNNSLLSKRLNTVVFIGYVWPEPNSSAAGSRMLQLINFFKQYANRVIFASPAMLSEHRANLTDNGVEEVAIELNNSSFDQWIKNINPDAVIFDRFMMEEQFGWRVEQQCPFALRILDTEDLHSLRQVRHARLKQAIRANQEIDKEFANKALLFEQMQKEDICLREIAAIYRCDLSLMISHFEIDLLTQVFNVPANILCHLPFMLTPCHQQATLTTFEQRQHFVTIGNFRHAPNWDSVLWLKHSIWPKIRQQIPSAQLHIYGAYPAKKVTDLHQPKQGFFIEGWADDALAVLANARICLAPLRFGAGIKGKLTDAMLTNTPSITTPVGAEAMAADYQWPGIIAQTSESIATAAVELYQSQELWQQAANQSPRILENCYNHATLSTQLATTLVSLIENNQALRAANFTGSLLRHHHHKSTQYMAQWIEAKNK